MSLDSIHNHPNKCLRSCLLGPCFLHLENPEIDQIQSKGGSRRGNRQWGAASMCVCQGWGVCLESCLRFK